MIQTNPHLASVCYYFAGTEDTALVLMSCPVQFNYLLLFKIEALDILINFYKDCGNV